VQLRITITEEPAGAGIRVDGWLTGDTVAELVRVLDAAPAPARLLLHDLRGADAAGLSALNGLADRGVPLEGLSTYLGLLLASSRGARRFAPPGIVRSETPVVRRQDT
jgi:hypothetical protein